MSSILYLQEGKVLLLVGMRPHFAMSSIGNGLRRLESRRRKLGLGAGGPAPRRAIIVGVRGITS